MYESHALLYQQLLKKSSCRRFQECEGNMCKIFINGRDEMCILDLERIVCFKADSNYTTAYYANGLKTTVAITLNRAEELILSVVRSELCDYIRVGRSYIINAAYIHQISPLRQRLVLSDGRTQMLFKVTKGALKKLKEEVADRYYLHLNQKISLHENPNGSQPKAFPSQENDK